MRERMSYAIHYIPLIINQFHPNKHFKTSTFHSFISYGRWELWQTTLKLLLVYLKNFYFIIVAVDEIKRRKKNQVQKVCAAMFAMNKNGEKNR